MIEIKPLFFPCRISARFKVPPIPAFILKGGRIVDGNPEYIFSIAVIIILEDPEGQFTGRIMDHALITAEIDIGSWKESLGVKIFPVFSFVGGLKGKPIAGV